MSDHRAKTTKRFYGVEDGKIYPKWFEVGDPLEGDLAKVAKEEKWAVEPEDYVVGEQPLDGEILAPGDAEGEIEPDQAKIVAAADAGAGQPGAEPVAAVIDIPADWKTMKWFALKALAEKIAGEPVADSDQAKAVIETEIARRAPVV